MLVEFADGMSRATTDNRLTNGSLVIHGCKCWPIGRDGRPSVRESAIPTRLVQQFVPSFFFFYVQEYVVEREDSCPFSDGDRELDHHLESMWEQSGVPRPNRASFDFASTTVSSPQFTAFAAPHPTFVSGSSDANISETIDS